MYPTSSVQHHTAEQVLLHKLITLSSPCKKPFHSQEWSTSIYSFSLSPCRYSIYHNDIVWRIWQYRRYCAQLKVDWTFIFHSSTQSFSSWMVRRICIRSLGFKGLKCQIRGVRFYIRAYIFTIQMHVTFSSWGGSPGQLLSIYNKQHHSRCCGLNLINCI